jgi:hypothetical protein
MAGAKFILESRFAAPCNGAVFVTLGFMRRKLLLFPFARVVVNQWHASCSCYLLSDRRAAISSVHQLAPVSTALMGMPQQAVSMCSLQPFQLIL